MLCASGTKKKKFLFFNGFYEMENSGGIRISDELVFYFYFVFPLGGFLIFIIQLLYLVKLSSFQNNIVIQFSSAIKLCFILNRGWIIFNFPLFQPLVPL